MKSLLSLLVAMCVIIGGLTATPAVAAEKKIRLTFVSSYMDRHYVVQNVFIPWIEEVKKRTNGQVEIVHFNPNTISPDAETYDAVISGALDIGSGPMGRNPGKFPYATLAEMPFIVESAESGSLAFWELYNTRKEIQDEFKDTKVLWMNTAALAHIYSAKKPMNTLADLQGEKALAVGASQVEVAKGLGMVPVATSYPEAYLSLQRGMANSIIATFPILKSLKINEVTRYVTVANLRTSSCYTVMNKKKWDSLPENVKQVLEELGGATMSRRVGHALDSSVNEDLKSFRETKNTIYVLPESELKIWREKLAPVSEGQVRLLKDKGLDKGQEILDDARRLGAEWAKKVPSIIKY